MQPIWPRLADELCGHLVLVSGPLVLNLQLPQPLRPRQRSLKSLNPASEVILGLVEDLLGLEDVQYLGLPVQDLLSEKEVGKLLHRNIRLVTLLLEEFRSLRARGLEGFHPGRSWSHWVFNNRGDDNTLWIYEDLLEQRRIYATREEGSLGGVVWSRSRMT